MGRHLKLSRSLWLGFVLGSFPMPALSADPVLAPEWVAVPQLSVRVWPDPIVLPAPIVVTLTFAAPVDDYAMGPAADSDDRLLVLVEAVLADEAGSTLAHAYKMPESAPGIHFWPSPIPPRKVLEKQLVILWRQDEDAWKRLARNETMAARLVVKCPAPRYVLDRLPDGERDRFTSRMNVRIRVPASEDTLAFRIFQEELLTDYGSWDWAYTVSSKRLRLEGLLAQSEQDSTWQLTQALLLWQKIQKATPTKPAGPAPDSAELAAEVDEFTRRFPTFPLSDDLLYRFAARTDRRDPRAREKAAAMVRERFPDSDIGKSAWYWETFRSQVRWPTSRPSVSVPGEAGAP